ncbi:hypothetical protein AB0A63_21190 [Lentzea sp. NPDC042327]|uniref:hypothetical protein n=1 Tax=Lentzea sp. NPDC042327 TaxID=3154801 RepID=UPI0033E07B6D
MSSAGLRAKTGANGIRRFATRALLAVGGAVAGTAVAWVLSTTAAHAADDAEQFDVVTKIATVDEKLPVVVPATEAVHKIDEALRAEHEKARDALPQVQVQQAVEQITERVLPRVTTVVTPTTPAVARAEDVTYVATPADAPETGQSPVAKVISQLTGPSGATWTKLLETRHLVVPSAQHPSLPADPSPELPVPAPAPVHCTCSSDGSGAAGGSNKAAFAAPGSVHDTAVASALAPSTAEVSVKPGKQPGTTPD